MANLSAWLLAMAAPLTGKVLFALGFQVVTLTGMVASIAAIKALFLQHMGAVPAAGFQLGLMAGAGEGFGMIFGAIAFRVTMYQLQSATRILASNQ